MGKKLLLDGFNLAFRSFFAIPELTRADGFPTNALHGWLRTLLKLEDQEAPCSLEVFFDLGGDTRREALHPEYKAQRDEMPEPLALQLPHIKQFTHELGLVVWELEGVEADDLMAGRAKELAANGDEVWLVTADKDLAQVVGGNISMLVPPPTANPKLGWRRWGPTEVEQKFGVGPERIADYLALVGDNSDNIPGIAGVGPKTASNWLNQYGDLEAVLAAANTIKPPRFREVLAAEGERIRGNLDLTRLVHPIPMPPVPPAQRNPEACLQHLLEMEMRTMHSDLAKRWNLSPPEEDFRLE